MIYLFLILLDAHQNKESFLSQVKTIFHLQPSS